MIDPFRSVLAEVFSLPNAPFIKSVQNGLYNFIIAIGVK